MHTYEVTYGLYIDTKITDHELRNGWLFSIISTNLVALVPITFMSKWLKLDPYRLWQKYGAKNL